MDAKHACVCLGVCVRGCACVRMFVGVRACVRSECESLREELSAFKASMGTALTR